MKLRKFKKIKVDLDEYWIRIFLDNTGTEALCYKKKDVNFFGDYKDYVYYDTKTKNREISSGDQYIQDLTALLK